MVFHIHNTIQSFIMRVIISNGSCCETEEWDDVVSCSDVYAIKKRVSERKKISLSSIHIVAPSIDKASADKASADKADSSQPTPIYIKIVPDRCATCFQRYAKIIGDCRYCKLKYCSSHRLPEVHHCPEMEACRSASHTRNTESLLKNKCVSSTVSGT